MVEIWKAIEGYEGLYEVSNIGRVRSLDYIDNLGRNHRGRVLKPQLDGRKHYYHVNLGRGNIRQVHRLVADAFIPNPNNLPQVNHRDENKTNNCVENLEWCSVQYNNAYGSRKESKRGENHHGAKLTEQKVREIKSLYQMGHLQKDIASAYDMSTQQISAIINGRCWGWVI